MTQKVFIKTFGCQMNEYDSDKMLDVLNAAELANKTWPRTPAEAAGLQFNPGNQTWSKP